MRKSLRKSLTVFAVGGMVACLCVGSAGAKSRATVSISLLVPTTQQPAFSILIPNFERVYPDIHVEVTYLASTTIPTVLLTQFQAGNAPDMFHMQSGRGNPSAVTPLGEAGRLLDLTGEVWAKRLTPYMRPAVTVNGRMYAYPYALYTNNVVYNVDQFKQYGLSVPTTFAQVLALCKKVSANGKIAFVQPFGEVSSGALLAQQRAVQYVYSKYPNWNTLRAQGKMTFQTTPEWRRAFQSIVDMKDAGCFQPGAQGTSASQQFATFARGDAVETLLASTQYGNIPAANPNIKTKYYNLPGDTASQQALFINANMVGIRKDTAHPTEAKLFIKFLSRPKQAALFAKVGGGNSYYDVIKGVLPEAMVNLRPLIKAGKVVWAPHTAWPNPAAPTYVYGNGVQGLFTGQRTVDDLLKTLDYMWDNPTATTGP
jgi:raffinose/stachyose/melibiose transport system substrate-binding protein